MEITIKGKMSDDPRDRILTIEAVTKSLCEQAAIDPAEGVMMLLTAAVHLTTTYARPGTHIEMALARALGSAMAASDGFFKLRLVDGSPHIKRMEAKTDG